MISKVSFIPSTGNYCLSGDCEGWTSTASYFTDIAPDGTLTIELNMKIAAPFTLDSEMVKAGFIVSSSKNTWTELFGCSWSPLEFEPSRCAAAMSPTKFHKWFNGNKGIKYAAAGDLWLNMDSRIDQSVIYLVARRKYVQEN